ncbi:putative methyltransferase PMT15 [Cocos nucifera]|uniref:Methyltransferase n=1 Tax=Cocos nucifera TaxID=13894 RepID=A0A8K0IKN5_COCNU|nr:putative methyltransferase PMT15 [Cocos nucifera]
MLKVTTTTTPLSNPEKKIPNLFPLLLLALLCSASYLLAALWRTSNLSSSSVSSNTTISSSVITLDFNTYHGASAAAGRCHFPVCDAMYTDYTPCHDHSRSLKFPRERHANMERHCPAKNEILRCLVQPPAGYRRSLPWPESRDAAWFANVPYKKLVAEKGNQNWVRVEGDRFRFPGGGTTFPRGADAYIKEIGRLIPLHDGSIRTALDAGCGVASWGAYLLSQNILTMSFAPRDSHKAQVQLALERGLPAMLGIFATDRLPYPSRAFDMAHCSRCLIPWHLYDGLYLIEIDRILRPGGYWILSGPPINWKQHWKGWRGKQKDLSALQSTIEAIARSLCWKKLKEKEDIAIWQKPANHIECSASQNASLMPGFCSAQEPDAAWYTKMGACITPLPKVAGMQGKAGGELEKWPKRLVAVPPRISSGSINGVTPKMFLEDTELWKRRVRYCKAASTELAQKGRYRNLLDMNSGLGGFAAAMIDDPVWVMNVVPTVAKVDTLGVIYERGLIGTYQDWCEAISTYPRTYDLLHADSVFTLYKDRCEMEDILLEMDRILRPEGTVIFRDDVDILVRIKSIADGMRWNGRIVDHEDGPLQREKLLIAVKATWSISNQTQ